MVEKNSNQKSNSSNGADATILTDTSPSERDMVQNVLLIWVDGSIDESKQNCQDTLAQLRGVVNNVSIFTSPDECVDFLSEVDDQKAYMIISGTIGEQLVPHIHDMSQLDAIYIFCGNKSRHEQWAKEWAKVKGVYTDIKLMCEALQMIVKECDQDSIPVSFVTKDEDISNQNLDQLDPSFMYTQIFKEILLEMEYDQQSIKKFTNYCRNADYGSLKDINQFEDEYQSHQAVSWYTRSSFIYSLLNQALRTLEADTIINMGFFIHDLHRQIEQLHKQQLDSYHGQIFTVYRGQGLSQADFEKLRKTKGGLMSFNNFLSTSKDREISLAFAEGASTSNEMVGVLFQMTIDPSISAAPFADIQEVSYFKSEEMLFSMHTVFRIVDIKNIDSNNRLFQVELKLTVEADEQLRALTERFREETGGSAWQRLGSLLLKIGQFNKAEELYTMLLEQTSDEGEKALYYNQLGLVKDHQGDYEKAIGYYEKGLEINQKILPLNHPSLATSYGNIGSVYVNMGKYSKALSFYEKALEIQQKAVPLNHPNFATSHNNIGRVYMNMGEYLKALSSYEKAFEIQQKTLPPNHPDFATSYNNIGTVYYNMGEYSKALSSYEKALAIRQKTLPRNHPDFGTSYNNIGGVYDSMGEYSKALLFYEKDLEISQKTLPPNHPALATSYNNIGLVYNNMRDYSKALSSHEKALEIREKILPPNHPDLATSCNNIGWAYRAMDNYSKALPFYERALDIWQHSLPLDHPDIRNVRESMEFVKTKS